MSTPVRASSFPLSDELLFLRSLLTRPRNIGAVAPSSGGLARAMAEQIDLRASEPVLELGPGTGVITGAILARGIAPERVTLVEYDPNFAALLASRYPKVRVINGDAFALAETLGPKRRGPYAVAISGLPLLNFREDARRDFIATVLDHVVPHGPLVQYSYGLHPPVAPPAGATVTQAAFVLFNLPPARVWVYRKA